MDCDSDDAKRQQEQPDEWIGDQGQEGKRPAEYEQKAPEEECEHDETSLLKNCTFRVARKFRARAEAVESRFARPDSRGRLSPHELLELFAEGG